MNSTISKVFIFSAGVAIGVAASWKFFETKYKKIAQEEIDSVKEVFAFKKEDSKPTEPDDSTEDDESKPIFTEEEANEYAEFVKDLGYTNEEKGVDNVRKEPYVLSPDEFGELADYGTESLTYYADGVLTDDFDNPIEDVGAMVVEDFADHFGEYEDDSVFVRNENHKTDYEILRDERNFSDVNNSRTYPVDEE
jgi:hypothetical protein